MGKQEPIIWAEETPPSMEGTVGRAWPIDVPAIGRRHKKGPNPEATTCGWIVEAKYAHPFWHSYMIACICLRPIDGAPAPEIRLPGATHEVIVAALNPDHKRPLNASGHYLLPVNFCGQWKAGTDDEARAYIEETVRLVIAGTLNPDTDYIRSWMHRFSASNVKDPARAGETRIIAEGTNGAQVEIVVPPRPGPQDLH